MGRRRYVAVGVLAVVVACAEYSEKPKEVVGGGVKCGDPKAPTCGTHGRCQDAAAGPSCACDKGYAGADCATCAPGYQDNDKDTVCLPDCGDLKCGAHERCSDNKAAAACVCAPGYVKEAAGCVFRGGPQDPTFENKPEAWKGTKAVVTPTRTTSGGGQPLVDPGAAVITGADACAAGASLAQTFEMPAASEAEPLALRWIGDLENCRSPFCRTPFVVQSRAKFLRDFQIQGRFGAVDTKVCIGEKWFGKTMDLSVASVGSCLDTPQNVVLDHFGIEPDPTCPAVGTIPNANFDGTGGWISSADAASTAEVANSVGTGGTRGGRLATTKLCQSPSLRGVMSPRETNAKKLALAFTYRGTNNQRMDVAADSGNMGTVRGTNVFEKASFCLPESMKGDVSSLTLRTQYKNPPSGGVCDLADVREFVFDDFELVADPKCPDQVFVPDGGFEETGVASSWSVSDSNGGTSTRTSSARSGKSAAYLAGSSVCASASVSTLGTIPDSAGQSGPALKFWIRGQVTAPASFNVPYAGGAVPPTDTWTQRTVCISPKESGRTRALSFSIYVGGTGNCGTFAGTSAYLQVDDVELTTDPTCPSQ